MVLNEVFRALYQTDANPFYHSTRGPRGSAHRAPHKRTILQFLSCAIQTQCCCSTFTSRDKSLQHLSEKLPDRTSELFEIPFTETPATPRLAEPCLGLLDPPTVCSVTGTSFVNKIFLCTFLIFTTQLNFSQTGFYIYKWILESAAALPLNT